MAAPVEFVQEALLCARYGELDELKQLIEAHKDTVSLREAALCRSETGGHTPLHMAAANGHVSVLEYLVSGLTTVTALSTSIEPVSADAQKAAVNVQNDEGSTPLHWASLNGHLDAVNLLLAHGARATLRNKAGKSAVTVAAQADKAEIVDVLLKSYDEDDVDEEDGVQDNVNVKVVAGGDDDADEDEDEQEEVENDPATAGSSSAER
ncbi:ankyrin repeat-containing domain protein [Entophlyctis helioformis]|nr:ankyrin repeat-containing domain protein [Entophlyctis helioformis]